MMKLRVAGRLSSWKPAIALGVAIAAALVIAWNLWSPAQSRSVSPASISLREGHAYTFPLWWLFAQANSDSPGAPEASNLVLLENRTPLGPRHEAHRTIADAGGGAYSHWGAQVIFSSSDNSDPRTNGRTYEARYVLLPARWLLWASALGLAWAIVVGFQVAGRRLGARAGFALRVAVGALFLAAVLASLTHLVPVRRSAEFAATALANESSIGVLPVTGPRRNVKNIPFERLVAPFIIVPSGTDDAQGGYVRVSIGGTQLREVYDVDQLLAAKDAVFLDGDRFGGEDWLVSLPPGLGGASKPFVLNYRVVVTRGAIAALWALLALAVLALLTHRRLAGQSPRARALLTAGTTIAALAGLLLALDVIGLVAGLRPALPPVAFEGQPSDEPQSSWASSVDILDRELAMRPGERRDEYAARITHVVHANLRHVWNYANASKVGAHVRPWSNYVLWLLGEMDPKLYRYHYASWRPALERGVGMCSQATLILVGILREHGYDARIVQLTGHTVVTAEVADGKWYVLDPDYGVVIPESVPTIERAPEIVRDPYERLFREQGFGDYQGAATSVIAFYASHNYVEPKGGEEMLGAAWAVRERFAEVLKWAIAIVLLAISALLLRAGGLVHTSRRTGQ